MMLKQKLILIRGLPGSGKSTFANLLLSSNAVDHLFETDQFFIKDGIYSWNGDQIVEAHEWCLAETKKALLMKNSVAVCNTFTRERELRPYIDFAKYNNIPYTSIIIENRHGNKSIHGVPERTMDAMFNRFSISLRGDNDAILEQGPS